MDHEEESVIVLPAKQIRQAFEDSGCEGFMPADKFSLSLLIRMANAYGGGSPVYMKRKDAETDFNRKHLISYITVNHDGRVLAYKRGKSGGESRLHDKFSIGVGGHVNRKKLARAIYGDDGGNDDALEMLPLTVAHLYDEAVRELDEEIIVTLTGVMTGDGGDLKKPSMYGSLKYNGIISDDADDVGKVHLGISYEFSFYDVVPIAAHEDCLREMKSEELWTLKQLQPGILEGWSQILVDKVMTRARSTFFHGIHK